MSGVRGRSGGKNKKSLRSHLLAGTYRFGRHGEIPADLQHLATGRGRVVPFRAPEPAAEPTPPRCPAWLSKNAKLAWRRFVPDLRRMGVLTVADGEALAAFCQTHVRWREAERFIDEHGMVYPLRDEKGEIRCMKQFPQVSIARNLLVILKSFLQEFGMTPASRVRVADLLPPVVDPVPAGPRPTRDGRPVTNRLGETTDRLGRPI